MRRVPPIRIRAVNDRPVRADRPWIVYWMIASRRMGFNYGLQRAVEHARDLHKPLIILEALRVGYPWANHRLHRFVLEGMGDNHARCATRPVLHHPYVEPEAGAGRGLLEALAARASVVVTDEFPAFFLPRMVAAAAGRLDVRLEAVDGNGLLPLRATDRAHETAFGFRRLLQRSLWPHLLEPPVADPLRGARIPTLRQLPTDIGRPWPAARRGLLRGEAGALGRLPIDHDVPPVPYSGGTRAAVSRWRRFLKDGLARYTDRHHPDVEGTSGLSPWIHFGHLSVHQIFQELCDREGWEADGLRTPGRGQREGWWGMSPEAEAFLDQLVTWRELGFHFCAHRHDYDTWASLPRWARATLEEHRADVRPHLHSLEELEAAASDDPLWNATQRQLRAEGRIHNYLRMLWGKRVLQWQSDPREALHLLIHLNNKYAVDGRDPNSYSGIFWVFGRHDRPWPERPIFGKVRYMTSASARRKLRLTDYVQRWGP